MVGLSDEARPVPTADPRDRRQHRAEPRGGRSVLAGMLLIVLLIILTIAPITSTAREAPPAQPDQETDVIVVLKPGADPAEVARAAGVQPRHVFRHVFRGFAGRVPEQALQGLRRNPRVELISPDRPVTIAQQTPPEGIYRIEADQYPGAVGSGLNPVDADVAIVDTGIDLDHPDLTVAGGTNCLGGTSHDDNNGHGTHVAGTAAARDNTIGVVGVAPGARLWAVKVLDANGDGSWSSVICGLDWVYAHRDTIDVVNMSLAGFGGDSTCANDALHRAICRNVSASISVVVAAGNDSQNAANFVPATYGEVVTVSAFADFDGQPGGQSTPNCGDDRDDRFSWFSNYGADVDIAAPGSCVLSTDRGAGLTRMSGTSMAAPHVAGAVALYKAQNPLADAGQVRSWLLGPASDPQTSPAGFTDDPDGFRERVLNLDLSTAYPPDPISPEPARPPTARNDTYRVPEDKVLRHGAPGVLANDTDPEGGLLRVTRVIARPTKGTLRLRPNGAFVYRPKRNAHGSDVFTYEVVDPQGGKDTARVRIRILARPD
jgi:subtilisin family serine protease